MSVVIPFPIEAVEEQRGLPSLTYRLDRENKRIIGKVDGIEAVKQAIWKALATPRFHCLIYDNQYGSEIKQTIMAGDATPEFIEADMPRLVREALSQDARILGIYNFSFSFESESARIRFEVDTVFGRASIEGVIGGRGNV